MILTPYLRQNSPWLGDVSRLLDHAFQRASSGPAGLRIHEHDDQWTVEADFPGVSRDDLDLEVREGAVHLSVTSKSGQPERYRLPIGKQVEASAIRAKLELGVLTVTLPKAPKHDERRTIEIQS